MSWALRYVGLPFEDGGRGPAVVDCWGLVLLAYRQEKNIVLPDYGEISAQEARRISRATLDQQTHGPWRQVSEPQEFDVVVMRAPAHRLLCHIGVMISPHIVLHVERGSDTCLQNVEDFSIRPRLSGFWRHEALQ